MYVDNNLLVSGTVSGNTITGQLVTGAAPVFSANVIDLLHNRDIGEGTDLFGRFEITATFAGLTTLEMQVVTADDAGLTANLTVVGSTGAVPAASLMAGARFACGINPRIAFKGQRYIGCRYVPAGTGTAGALVGDLGVEIQDGQKFYPSGYAVA